MNRATKRALAALICAAAVGSACGAPAPQQPEPVRRSATATAPQQPVGGRAEQQLPRVAPSRGAARARVLGRHDARLSLQDQLEHGERLLDSDVTTAPVASGPGSVRLRVNEGTISSLRVFGALDAIREVRAMRNGRAERVEVDLRAMGRAEALRWHTIVLPPNALTNEVELVFGGGVGEPLPTEIEAWGSVEEQPPAQRMADRLLRSTSGFDRTAATAASHRVSTVDLARDQTIGRFVLRRTADAPVCRRAFLRYSLDGAAHWSQVAKTLNGGSLGQPSNSRSSYGGVQIEEVPASVIRAGENELRFEAVRALDPSGYVVSDVELLCATAELALLDDGTATASVLADGDVTTAVTGTARSSDRSLSWTFGGPAQAHSVSFRIDAPSGGTLELHAEGTRTIQRIDLTGRDIGWHDVLLPDSWPVASSLTARVLLPREGTGSVSEIRVGASPAVSEAQQVRLRVTWPLSGECVDGRMNIRGFLVGNRGERPWSTSAGASSASIDEHGAFTLANVAVSVETGREIEVRATDGERSLSQWIPVARCASSTPQSVAGRADEGAPFAVTAEPTRDTVLEGGGLRVEIPRGAVSASTSVSARPLASAAVQPMDNGMSNVTAGRGAWRLGPSPMRFLAPVKISFPIDRAALPAGKTEHDVQLFYFDEGSRRWASVSSEVRDGVVTARTDHFTDWVAATVSSPDSPESSASDGQGVGALGAGHPLAGVHGASAPAVNSQGTATSSFPIVVPPGRHGMQPSLSLTYDSSSGASFVGQGWNLSIPSISIDTRFGVPTYSGGESYLLNGASIEWASRLSEDGSVIRDLFESRVLTTGLRIVRVLTGAVITWEVTDPSGTTSYFGLEPESRLSAPLGSSAPTLPDPDPMANPPRFRSAIDRTGVWYLSETIDRFNNTVLYHYTQDFGALPRVDSSEPAEPWVSIIPSSIDYTGHTSGSPSPHYQVVFDGNNSRSDVSLSGRFGFVTRSAGKLNAILVRAGGALVRRYQLDYREGEFGKTLLQRVIVQGADGITELFRNEFDYYGAHRDSATGNLGFSDAQQWTTTSTPFALEAGFGNAGGIAGYAGVGDPLHIINIGAGIGGDFSHANNDVASTDVNGDGLVDFIRDTGHIWLNSFAAVAGVADRTRGVLLNSTLPLRIDVPFLDEQTESISGRGGLSLLSGIGAIGGTGSASWSHNNSMFLDVDGDGRPDVINGTTHEDGQDVLSVRLNPFQMGRGSFGVLPPSGSTVRDYKLGGLQLDVRERTINLPPDLAGGQQFYRTAPLMRWTSQITGKVRLQGVIERTASGGDGVEGAL